MPRGRQRLQRAYGIRGRTWAERQVQQHHASKSKRWWKCVFFWLFDCACYNAYLIYCNTGKGRRSDKMPYREFLIQLSDELIGQKSHRRRARKRSKPETANSSAKELGHYQVGGQQQVRFCHCGDTRTRLKCAFCENRICRACWALPSAHGL